MARTTDKSQAKRKTTHTAINPETLSQKEIGKDYVDRITKKRTFDPYYQKPQIGCRFWRPKRRGDYIIGHIFKQITNFRQSSSYPIKKLDGEIVELPGNKQLHRLIKKGDCFGQLIKIAYVGREFIINGHYRKIYRLYKIKISGVSQTETLEVT